MNAKRKPSRRQSSQYDKIFKENIEAVIPSLMQNVLGITAVSMEELPDDVQHTKERKPDVLKKVTDIRGDTFVLQIEFQVADEPEMVYRMGEYYFMLIRKYKLPVMQVVIYLGSSTPKMATKLKTNHLRFDFRLISFVNLDFRIFINSPKPEEIVLGILAKLDKKDPENSLKQIISRIQETTETPFELERYSNQLRILAQLRNLDLKLKNAMDSIAKYINEERDVLYLRGIDKGEEKAEERFVRNLLAKMSLTLEQIADVAGVSVEFVKNVKQKLSADK